MGRGGEGRGGEGRGGEQVGGRENELIDIDSPLLQYNCCKLSSLAVLLLAKWSGGR